MGETRHAGYGSDAEYRAAIAKEVDKMAEASEAMTSKPLYASELAREAEPTQSDLLLQATTKLTEALTSHRGELGAAHAFAATQAMIEGAVTPEAAALAVVAFASSYPDYAPHAVEAMQATWGEWGDEALAETVNEIAYAEAAQEVEEQTAAWNEHVEHRSDVIRDLSNQIAEKDGPAVRDVTAALASSDETLVLGDDVQATAALFGYRQVAKSGEASLAKEGFLRAFDDEVERNGLGGRLHTDEERERFQRKQAEASAQIANFDPDQAFARGHADAMRRVHESVTGLPFDEAAFDEEAKRFERPEHAQAEAINAREAREEAEHLKRFGVPREQ